jgi:hypothetical protein
MLIFYMDFQFKISVVNSNTDFQKPFYMDFQSENHPLFSGRKAWVGLLGGRPAAAVCARSCTVPQQPPRRRCQNPAF